MVARIYCTLMLEQYGLYSLFSQNMHTVTVQYTASLP